MTNLTCEFYSPINKVGSFGVLPVSDRMYSTMEFFPRADGGGGCIEWIVYDADGNDEFVEHIGIWWSEDKSLMDYDGVFSLPLEAMQLLAYAGYTFDPEDWEQELAYPQNPTFTLLID